MITLVLRIFDMMRRRRLLRTLSLLLFTAVLLVPLTIHMAGGTFSSSEDITDFLPAESADYREAMEAWKKSPETSRIVVLFSQKANSARNATLSKREKLPQAIDRFTSLLEERDTTGMVHDLISLVDMEQMARQMYQRVPLLLTDSDYARADSLLSDSSYILRQLRADKQMLLLPMSGMLTQSLQYDPLNLFTPALQRLQGQQSALVMLTSPYGSSETGQNGKLTDLLNDCIQQVQRDIPEVSIHLTGAPVIAVGNARQIKADSLLAVSLAVVLIVCLLFVTFRQVRNIVLIVLSIGWGWLFAVGTMLLINTQVSVIVIGISSVILGIAVNYPLHLTAHLRHTPDVRQALKEIVMPLLVGNVTTVGAFLALVPLDAVALRHLGLFSSLLLVGTILFVLLWLPHMVKPAAAPPASVRWLERVSSLTLENKRWLVGVVTVLTFVLGYYSLQTGFDADLNNINYMTPEQKLIANSQQPTANSQRLIAIWNSFISRHGTYLQSAVTEAARAEGFADHTFDGFFSLLTPQVPKTPPLSTLVTHLSDDFNYIGWACGLIVFFFLWFSLGSIELALLSFLPMAVSWIWILGIMVLCGIQFNVVNIILATFIFGQGDDYTIFMTEGCQYEYAYRRKMLASYKHSIIISALIMFIGIGTLIFAKHPALHSLAEVTMVGMFSVVLMAWLFPPLIFRWLVCDRQGYRRQPITLRTLLLRLLPWVHATEDPFRLVADRYRYRGVEISSAVNRRLRQLRHTQLALTAQLTDEGWGETALLMALQYPDTIFAASIADPDRLLVARYAAEGLAPNLTFIPKENS